MRPVRDRLARLLSVPVELASRSGGRRGRLRRLKTLEAGQVLLLENSRWEEGETKNDPDLAAGLAESGRPLRERRLRRRASRARDDRGRCAPPARVRGPPARARALRADGAPGRSRAAAGRRPRRGQGVRQDRRPRPVPRDRGQGPDRRRDVLRVLPAREASASATRFSPRRASPGRSSSWRRRSAPTAS